MRDALAQSRALDTAGVFATNVADAGLMAQILIGGHRSQHYTVADAAAHVTPVEPNLAFLKTPMWGDVDYDAAKAFEDLAATMSEAALPDWAAKGLDWHRIILEADIARSFAAEYARDGLSPLLRAMIERGKTHLAVDYNDALDGSTRLRNAIHECLSPFDAILTPGTQGTAPRGLGSTGSPMFCSLWTLAGVPTISLPLLKGADGLPLGVQLVGRYGDDARLLRTAGWLMERAGSVR